MRNAQKKPKLPAGLYWRGGVIWMRSQRAGASFAESTGTDDVALALQALRERQARSAQEARTKARPRPRVDPYGLPPLTTATLLTLDHARGQAEGASEGTLAGLAYAYRHLGRHLPAREVARPSPLTLIKYVTARREDGVGNNTIRKELVAYRRGLVLAASEGYAVGPILRLPRLSLVNRKPGQAGTERTPDELRAWLAELQPEPRAAAVLILCTGLRHEEAARLRADMLRQRPGETAYLSLPASITKTKRARRVALTPLGVAAFLMAVPIDRSHRSAYKGASARAGITPYIHDRDLRHAFASLTSALGDPYAVHLAMGHGQTTASTYQHQDMERLAALPRCVEKALRLTTDWLLKAHMCRFAYSRGRQRPPPDASQIGA